MRSLAPHRYDVKPLSGHRQSKLRTTISILEIVPLWTRSATILPYTLNGHCELKCISTVVTAPFLRSSSVNGAESQILYCVCFLLDLLKVCVLIEGDEYL